MSDIVFPEVRHRKNDIPHAFLHALFTIFREPKRKSFSACQTPLSTSLKFFFRKPKTMLCMAKNLLRMAEKLRATKFKFRAI